MKITVDRFTSDNESTVSHISVDDKFVCFGLEDEFRAVKVPKETRIPAGTYEVALRTRGKHHQKYKQRFKEIHRGMLEILNVPGFTDILTYRKLYPVVVDAAAAGNLSITFEDNDR